MSITNGTNVAMAIAKNAGTNGNGIEIKVSVGASGGFFRVIEIIEGLNKKTFAEVEFGFRKTIEGPVSFLNYFANAIVDWRVTNDPDALALGLSNVGTNFRTPLAVADYTLSGGADLVPEVLAVPATIGTPEVIAVPLNNIPGVPAEYAAPIAHGNPPPAGEVADANSSSTVQLVGEAAGASTASIIACWGYYVRFDAKVTRVEFIS